MAASANTFGFGREIHEIRTAAYSPRLFDTPRYFVGFCSRELRNLGILKIKLP
ncbi:MAG: hypothetical protein QOC70_2623 [Verrucomicrobiota bacterium]|jgi:hypothetical protein